MDRDGGIIKCFNGICIVNVIVGILFWIFIGLILLKKNYLIDLKNIYLEIFLGIGNYKCNC